jgi:hypothetical protein
MLPLTFVLSPGGGEEFEGYLAVLVKERTHFLLPLSPLGRGLG